MIPALCGLGSVYKAFAAAAGRYPRRPFLHTLAETAAVYRIRAGEIGYRQMLEDADALAAEYAAAGYRRGQRVLVSVENRPALFRHWLALNRLGLSLVPVNPDLRAAELRHIAGHARPALALAVEERVGGLRSAAREAGRGFAAVALGQTLPAPAADAFRAGHEFGGDAGQDENGSENEFLREAALLYTSGTTGQPKGCVLSNRYFLYAGHWYRRAGGACALHERVSDGDGDGERMITPLPLFHMNALACSSMAMIAVGGCLIVLDRFHPRSWWQSVRDSRASCLHYLGVMPALLMAAPARPEDREHRVRFGFGAGVAPALHRPFERRFGFPLVEAWAMTETGAGAVIAANREPRRPGRGSFGRPRPEVELRIVDAHGAAVADGTPGELLVRHAGPDPRYGFFTEYFADPEASAAAWAGGWFHTGDAVRRDDDGELIFVDRIKNVIRRSGENIAAVEVEATLARHPRVSAVAVAAVPDPLRGDEVFACVVAEPEPAAGERETLAAALLEHCLAELAYYKAPGFIAFVDALPLTATQKLARGVLKRQVLELHRAAAAVNLCARKKRQRPPG